MFIVYCHLVENPRMVSIHLLPVATKRAARQLIDGEHIIDEIITLLLYIRNEEEWPNLTLEQEKSLIAGKSVCLFAGT